MKILVMNRYSAATYSQGNTGIKTAMISINDIGDPPNEIRISDSNVSKLLTLFFYDVEEGNGAMTEKDAQKVAKFVKEIKDDYQELIVHCTAGVSRSAGVAAAIMKYLTGDDSSIFNSWKYNPNMHCYRLVLNALYEN